MSYFKLGFMFKIDFMYFHQKSNEGTCIVIHSLCFKLSDQLGLNSGQKKNLKILLHVLYSNPKVLYAPNNTAVNMIVKKVLIIDFSC